MKAEALLNYWWGRARATPGIRLDMGLWLPSNTGSCT